MRGRRRCGRGSSQTTVVTTTERVVTLELRDEPLPREPAPAPATDGQDDEGSKEKHIKWAEDTVDNEFLNRKKSKICCIFHKKRAFGESSSSESDDGH